MFLLFWLALCLPTLSTTSSPVSWGISNSPASTCLVSLQVLRLLLEGKEKCFFFSSHLTEKVPQSYFTVTIITFYSFWASSGYNWLPSCVPVLGQGDRKLSAIAQESETCLGHLMSPAVPGRDTAGTITSTAGPEKYGEGDVELGRRRCKSRSPIGNICKSRSSTVNISAILLVSPHLNDAPLVHITQGHLSYFFGQKGKGTHILHAAPWKALQVNINDSIFLTTSYSLM